MPWDCFPLDLSPKKSKIFRNPSSLGVATTLKMSYLVLSFLRSCVPRLPYLADYFAPDFFAAGLFVRHDAARSGNDGCADAEAHAGNLGDPGVNPLAGFAHPLDPGNRRDAGRSVGQLQAQGFFDPLSRDLDFLDPALVLEHAREIFFEDGVTQTQLAFLGRKAVADLG